MANRTPSTPPRQIIPSYDNQFRVYNSPDSDDDFKSSKSESADSDAFESNVQTATQYNIHGRRFDGRIANLIEIERRLVDEHGSPREHDAQYPLPSGNNSIRNTHVSDVLEDAVGFDESDEVEEVASEDSDESLANGSCDGYGHALHNRRSADLDTIMVHWRRGLKSGSDSDDSNSDDASITSSEIDRIWEQERYGKHGDSDDSDDDGSDDNSDDDSDGECDDDFDDGSDDDSDVSDNDSDDGYDGDSAKLSSSNVSSDPLTISSYELEPSLNASFRNWIWGLRNGPQGDTVTYAGSGTSNNSSFWGGSWRWGPLGRRIVTMHDSGSIPESDFTYQDSGMPEQQDEAWRRFYPPSFTSVFPADLWFEGRWDEVKRKKALEKGFWNFVDFDKENPDFEHFPKPKDREGPRWQLYPLILDYTEMGWHHITWILYLYPLRIRSEDFKIMCLTLYNWIPDDFGHYFSTNPETNYERIKGIKLRFFSRERPGQLRSWMYAVWVMNRYAEWFSILGNGIAWIVGLYWVFSDDWWGQENIDKYKVKIDFENKRMACFRERTSNGTSCVEKGGTIVLGVKSRFLDGGPRVECINLPAIAERNANDVLHDYGQVSCPKHDVQLNDVQLKQIQVNDIQIRHVQINDVKVHDVQVEEIQRMDTGLINGTDPRALIAGPFSSELADGTARQVTTGATTTIYVGIPLGALSLWVLAFYCCSRRKRQARPLLPISRLRLTNTVQLTDNVQLGDLPPRTDTVAASSSIEVPSGGRRSDEVEVPSSIITPNFGPRPDIVGVASSIELSDIQSRPDGVGSRSVAELSTVVPGQGTVAMPSSNRRPRVRFSNNADDIRVFNQHPDEAQDDDELQGQDQNNDRDGTNETPEDTDLPPGDAGDYYDTVIGAMAQLDLGRRLGHRRNDVNGVDIYHSFRLDPSTHQLYTLKSERQRQQAVTYVRRILDRVTRRRALAAGAVAAPAARGSLARPAFAGDYLYPSFASFNQWSMANAYQSHHNETARHARAPCIGRRPRHRRNAVNTHSNLRMLGRELHAVAAQNFTVPPGPSAASSSAGSAVGGDHFFPPSMSFSGWIMANALKPPFTMVACGAQGVAASARPSNQGSSSIPTSSVIRGCAYSVTNPLHQSQVTEPPNSAPGADVVVGSAISDGEGVGETESEAEYEYDETLYCAK